MKALKKQKKALDQKNQDLKPVAQKQLDQRNHVYYSNTMSFNLACLDVYYQLYGDHIID